MEQTKLTVSTIKTFPSNMYIWDTLGNCHSIDLDGQWGEFTRDEWKNDPIIELFNEDGQDRILSALDTLGIFSEE